MSAIRLGNGLYLNKLRLFPAVDLRRLSMSAIGVGHVLRRKLSQRRARLGQAFLPGAPRLLVQDEVEDEKKYAL